MLAVVRGGSTRAASALAGVEAAPAADIVLVHDAARPFVDPVLGVRRLATPRVATVRRFPSLTRARHGQTGRRGRLRGRDASIARRCGSRRRRRSGAPDWMLEALAPCGGLGRRGDRRGAGARTGRTPRGLVPGDPENVKITTPQDVERRPPARRRRRELSRGTRLRRAPRSAARVSSCSAASHFRARSG